MKKSIKSVLFVMLAVPLLCAIGENVELLDNRKLIDLDKAIEFARPGGDSITPQEGDSEIPPESETVQGGTSQTSVVEIRIEGVSVYYNGKKLGTEDFRKKLTDDKDRGRTFVLVDDFAEAKVYKRVRNTLRKLRDDIGLEFTEKVSEED